MRRLFALTLALMLCLALVPTVSAHDMGKVGEDNVLSVTNLALSGHRGAAIDPDHTLWVWGMFDYSGYYESYGHTKGPLKAYPTPKIEMEDIASVSCGDNFNAVIKTDGSLWLWGDNSYGQIGNGETSYVFVKEPVKIMEDVAAVSCGCQHAAAIKTDGSLWVWGSNGYCNLGIEEEGVRKNASSTLEKVPTPTKLMDGVKAVCCARDYTAAIKEDGSLWTWGRDDDDVLGAGRAGRKGGGTFRYRDKPAKVTDDVVAIGCGDSHMAAIKSDGSLWIWGSNRQGRLGCGDEEGRSEPLKLMEHVVAVSCGGSFTAAIRDDGSLWMWGDNEVGQLGNGRKGNVESKYDCYQTVPIKIMDDVSAVRCGYDFTIAIKNDGSVWSWGNNDGSGLGNGGTYEYYQSFREYVQSVPLKILDNVTVPAVYDTPLPDRELFLEQTTFPDKTGTAYPSTQVVDVDGKAVEFQCYALKDENGNDTNYIKLRDLADILNGSAVQFEIEWTGEYLDIDTGEAYTPNGTEGVTPFSGERAYEKAEEHRTRVNGRWSTPMASFTLFDDNGGGYSYYQLRHLGKALGFNVGWSADKGVYIETDKPYDYSN